MRQTHHLLIVDDDPAIRRILRLVLEDEGYQVETAANSTDALSKLQTVQPDLMLVDIEMPGLDGLELLDRVAQLPQAPPSIVVSASVESRGRAREAGAADFVGKPFDVDGLLSTVASVLEAPR